MTGQTYLEDKFPGYHLSPAVEAKDPSVKVQAVKKLNVLNTIYKFTLDQVLGGTVNTYAFIAAFAYFQGRPVLQACRDEFWDLRIASLKLWPAVSLLSYTVVPVEHRIL